MGRRAKRRRVRRLQRRPSVLGRFVRFVRELFSGGPESWREAPDSPSGGVGVREPRRPNRPSSSGAVALEAPPEEKRDVWAVGEEDRG